MKSRWHILHDGIRHGPFCVADLRRLVTDGVFSSEVAVSQEGGTTTCRASQVLSGTVSIDNVHADFQPVADEASPRHVAVAVEKVSPTGSRASDASTRSARQLLGIHPLVALGVIALDLMLFGGEFESAGLTWLFVSLPAALLLIPAAAIVQRFAYGDNWTLAWGKALLLGILTAIPTALPSIIVGVLGVAGGLKPERRILKK